MQVRPTACVLVACSPEALLGHFPALVRNAVVVADRIVRQNLFTSEAVIRDPLPVRGKNERLTPAVSRSAVGRLDARGIVRPGTEVKRGDILVGMTRDKAAYELTASERRILALCDETFSGQTFTENVSLMYTRQDPGVVRCVEVLGRVAAHCPRCGDVVLPYKIAPCPHCNQPVQNVRQDQTPDGCDACVSVEYVVHRKLEVGDVLCANGLRCTVGAIIGGDCMPTVGGEEVDILVHPGADLAAHLAQSGPAQHPQLPRAKQRSLVSFDRLEMVKGTLRQEEKVLARGADHTEDSYERTTQQPRESKTHPPGQLVDRATAGALLGAGYPANLLEMWTIKCDDMVLRYSLYYWALFGGSSLKRYGSEAAQRLEFALQAACLNPNFPKTDPSGAAALEIPIQGASSHDIRNWSFGEVKKPYTINYRTYRPEKDGLFCECIFGPEKDWECACGKYHGMKYKGTICDRCGVKVTHSCVRRKRMGHIELAAPVVHPWIMQYCSTALAEALCMEPEDVRKVVYYEKYAVTGAVPGWPLGKLLDKEQPSVALTDKHVFSMAMGAKAIRAMLQHRQHEDLQWVVLDALPVLPPGLRSYWLDGARKEKLAPLNEAYKWIIIRNNNFAKLVDMGAPESVLCCAQSALQRAVDGLFEGWTDSGKPQPGLKDELNKAVAGLMNKSVEFAARLAAIPGPSRSAGTVGIHPSVLVELLGPVLVSILNQAGYADTIKSAWKLLEDPSSPGVEQALRDAMASRPLLAVGPTGRTAVLRMEPEEAVEGAQLHPLDAQTLNITFAGDAVTLHVPLTRRAVEELEKPMICRDETSVLDGLTVPKALEAVLSGQALALHPLDRLALGVADSATEEVMQVQVSSR